MNTVSEKNLGYLFHHGPSYFGDGPFDVLLSGKPTREHFDPEKVHIIAGAPRGVQSLDIHHPWRLAKQYQVCSGHIQISDRYQKRIHVFTFGAQVRITAVTNHTLCQFTSPAPFLELTDGSSVTLMLANEVDILLAEQRARLNPRTPADFDSKLITIDPLLLYASCLNVIQDKFARITYIPDSTCRHFKHDLNLEITRLMRENSWPTHIPTLAECIET
jgi:hypothetical protein